MALNQIQRDKMNLRDWLIVSGIVIITGIILDGFRRVRLAKKDSLQMARDMGGDIENTPVDAFNPELPSGGARIIAGEERDATEAVVEKLEPTIGDCEPDTEDTFLDADSNLIADPQSRIEVETIGSETTHVGKKPKATVIEATSAGQAPDPLVIVINVHAQTNQGFPGLEIKKLLEACGLDHGDMSIFHRHEEEDLLSPVQFSVANAIEPGYFDPNTLGQISTPGVSFFMSLPGPKDYTKAFDYMLETAQCFARNLKGDLKDEHLSVMTSQTIEHSRQRIKDFERLLLSKSRT